MKKKTIITGASKGIGFHTVLAFLKKGHTVLAVARSSELLIELKRLANQYSGQLEVQSGDINDYKDRQILVSHFDEVDIVIHNAGYLVNQFFETITGKELKKIHGTNFIAPFLLTQMLMSKLSSDAHVIIISSLGGITGTQKFPGLTAYSSSKAAVACLAECLQAEYSNTNISFNALALGMVQTEMLSKAFPAFKASVTPQQMADYIYHFALDAPATMRGKVHQVSRSSF